MLSHRHMTKIAAALMAVVVCLNLCLIAFADSLESYADGQGIAMDYENELFNMDDPISINILMDEDQWADMLEHATDEAYYQCDVEINGTTFYRVGIRPKGNTSLSSIASDPDSDRYSFKLEFDQYVDGQTCFGLDKLTLNNNYADATNMKEALVFDMFRYLGADASLCNYAEIRLNGEYWGVYLALESVEDSFLLRNYGVQSGELYKPDSMNMGGGGNRGGENPGGMDFSNMMPPDMQQDIGEANRKQTVVPSAEELAPTDSISEESNSAEQNKTNSRKAQNDNRGGFSMGGGGADLNYSDDSLDSYSTIWNGAVTKTTNADHQRVVTALKNIAEGTNLEEFIDVDNLLKYMAVHVFSVNADSLSGNMAHNYYLYESEGMLNILPWDYNLILGGMGGMGGMGSSDATDVINDAIDTPFSGTEFFDALLTNESYCSVYHAYLRQLVNEYVLGGGFDAFYTRTRGWLDSLVETDPNALYSYEEYLAAAEMLYEAVQLRSESIAAQLDGVIPSTDEEQQDSDALIDASHLDLSVMGGMGGGRNQDRGGLSAFRGSDRQQTQTPGDAASDESAVSIQSLEGAAQLTIPGPRAALSETEKSMSTAEPVQGGDPPRQQSTTQPPGMMPPALENEEESGEAGTPEQTAPSQETTPDTQQPAASDQISGDGEETLADKTVDENNPTGFAPSFGAGNTPGENPQNTNGGSREWPGTGTIPDGAGSTGLSSTAMTNAISYCTSLAVLLAAFVFVLLYRRKPRRR